jgi:hypothetical protein
MLQRKNGNHANRDEIGRCLWKIVTRNRHPLNFACRRVAMIGVTFAGSALKSSLRDEK